MGELSAELNRLQKMRHPNVCDFLGEGLRGSVVPPGCPSLQAPNQAPGRAHKPPGSCISLRANAHTFVHPNVRDSTQVL